MHAIDVTIVGGGMITNDLLLPAIYHLQRTGIVGDIRICALNSVPLKTLRDNPELQLAFPGQGFTPYPEFSAPEDAQYPDLFKQAIREMPARQVVVIAIPDQFHYSAVKDALEANQHVLCVKPLVLKYSHAHEIEELAYEKGLLVGIEYHKRFDRRSLIARKDCRLGKFGQFAIGEAKMIEPYYYRFSNFQNWFTTDQTDPFVYVGCHYVDLVYFITGLRPVEVSVAGVKRRFPNGNEAYMWANGRIRYENGGLLSVTDGLGYPDAGAGSNDQGLIMFFEGVGRTGMIVHDDQYRGAIHTYLEASGPGGTHYNYINPDFFRLVSWEGRGFRPVGYGFDSVAGIIDAVRSIESGAASSAEDQALETRRRALREVDEQGLIATPGNSYVNELVVEAARLSIERDGEPIRILYDPCPRVEPRRPA